ncbi:chlorohydrolase [Streptococcus pneumoniae]|nr:chlorohydrolase [Streptococcus pneumoniae]
MKIKEQEASHSCSKHCFEVADGSKHFFEVVDRTDEVSSKHFFKVCR